MISERPCIKCGWRETQIRKKQCINGTWQVKHQCLNCGTAGNPIAHVLVGDMDKVPLWDEQLSEVYWRARHARQDLRKTGLHAIETHYHGYRFRSRLEARWAVFFDCLALSWEYEPECFRNGEEFYLPDFRVLYPDQGFPRYYWFEVKPHINLISPTEWQKMAAFWKDETRTLIVLDGPPERRLYLNAETAQADGDAGMFRYGAGLWSHKGRPWWDNWEDFFLSKGSMYEVGVQLGSAADAAKAARFE